MRRTNFPLLLSVLAGIALLAAYLEFRPRIAEGQEPLADVDTIESFRSLFIRDAGSIRLVLLLSPT